MKNAGVIEFHNTCILNGKIQGSFLYVCRQCAVCNYICDIV